MDLLIIAFGKLFSKIARSLNLGNGSTWPGHLALKINPDFIKIMVDKSNLRVILVAGTNGKTTTSLLLKTILEYSGKKVIHNSSGANLLNGIASTLLLNANPGGKINADFVIFEVDENTLIQFLKEIIPDYLILLNLFRDQLDRYGEVDVVAKNWQSVISDQKKTRLILNADDPQIAYLGKESKNAVYFGLDDRDATKLTQEHAADSIYCPNCGNKLGYKSIYYSHLGDWSCTECGLKRPKLNLSQFSHFPLSGLYNRYNTLASVLAAKQIGLSDSDIEIGLRTFKPAFGRQEIMPIQGKNVQIFLSKNPTGFNESLRTVKELGAKNILLVLNDGIADGRDVSWIWDIDTEIVNEFAKQIFISGDRVYDMALRIKYSMKKDSDFEKVKIIPDLKDAIAKGLRETKPDETLYILPTYTAMLNVRKILSGKKIL